MMPRVPKITKTNYQPKPRNSLANRPRYLWGDQTNPKQKPATPT